MSEKNQSGAEVLLRVLKDQGVEVIFGYPGGAVLPIYDAIFQQNAIRHILVRHEQAAVHAAEGYARSTGKVGVVLVTSGPGATNAVTGLLDALMDSVPLVCLTGQVPTHLIGNDAFQEADTTGITRPATKHNYLIKRAGDLARTVHEAFYVARSGRPGPVVIDLPKGHRHRSGALCRAAGNAASQLPPDLRARSGAIARAVALLRGAKRPMLYVGGGVINAGPAACATLVDFVRASGMPITNTLMGLGTYPASDRQFLGMLGMHGTYEANLAMHGCDVLLAIGVRFDDRVTGRLDAFCPGSKKIHADIDPSSINKNVSVDVAIVGDAGAVLRDLLAAWNAAPHDRNSYAEWWSQIATWRAKDCLRFSQDARKGGVIKPQYAIRRLHEITRRSGRDTFITTEVGQHQMWAAQHFGFDRPNRWMTQRWPRHDGLRPAGGDGRADRASRRAGHRHRRRGQHPDEHPGNGDARAVPPAGQSVHPQQPVHGDGEAVQDLLHGSRYSESYSEALPDFVRLAEAFHGHGLRVTSVDELDGAIERMLEIDGPVIVDVAVDPKENCYPMIPSGAAHNEMLLGPEHAGHDAGIGSADANLALV